MKKLQRGILITFEGLDGSGKTTVIQQVQAHFGQSLVTQEPGGSSLGQAVRAIVHNPESNLDYTAEYLLFAAARAQHIKEVIRPALAAKKIILCDRMGDSSLAYQGYGRGVDLEHIKKINEWVMAGIQPDLTFYIDIDHADARARIHARGELTSFEQEKYDFFERVLQGYTTIFQHAAHVKKIDGSQSPEAVAANVIRELALYLEEVWS
ncbi:MAG: dTMP kinase [Candidatus Babeliaceae bacterium]|jgi:dTMP kinase